MAGESGIPGRLVGSIDMYDGYTFVDVPAEYAENVLKAMSHAKDSGQKYPCGKGKFQTVTERKERRNQQ